MSDATLLLAGLGSVFLALCAGVAALAGASRLDPAVARSLTQVELMTGLVGGTPADQPLTARVGRPGLERMAGLARRLSPAGVASRLQHQLDLAGNPVSWPVERLFAVKGMGLLGGVALGAAIGLHSPLRLLLFGLLLGAAGFLLPDLLTYNAGLKRQQLVQDTLPDALDMLTVSVEAGLGFDAALSQVTRNTDGPLAGEFFRVLQEMQIGKSRADSFRAISERTTVPELRSFVSSLVQADTLGIPIAGVLREQAKEMRVKRSQRAEEKAQKIPIKILFPMIFCIFPAMFVVIIGPGAINVVHTFAK